MNETTFIEPYPIILTPLELAEKGHKNWSKKEAKQNLLWFLSIFPERLEVLSNFLDVDIDFRRDNVELLDEIVGKSMEIFRDERFHTDNKNEEDFSVEVHKDGKYTIINHPRIELTTYGASLAVDIGIVFAHMLMKVQPELEWGVGVGGKRALSYNLPVLKYGKFFEEDPIGAPYGNAERALKTGDTKGLERLLGVWSRRLQNGGIL
ncbi:MAG: hypothetical protein IPM61_01150 [Chlorobi bacterium]|nr:hypothetical protein [Chlorobiota bacterium]MBX7215655.1 hypothetical protein [Candidatus Kapabacteria bacterium]